MEKYTMFLDWKNQYSGNEYTTQSNLSGQISHSAVSNSLQPHEPQHARPPCPIPTPGLHWDSCPSSQWFHPAISSSVVHFSSCPQSSQHQSLLQWVSSSHEVAKVLEFQLWHHSFQRNPRADLLVPAILYEERAHKMWMMNYSLTVKELKGHGKPLSFLKDLGAWNGDGGTRGCQCRLIQGSHDNS